ncbi:MAG: HAD family hydrolase [Pseudomonadota bacterium]
MTPPNTSQATPAAARDLPRFDSIVFDLDGTLWDTSEACAQGWNNVIERRGIDFRKVTAADIRRVTGKPHEACVREVCVGLSEQQVKLLSDESEEEDNRVIAERGGIIYPGVAEGLPALAARHPLFIVSNCQAGYIDVFLAFTGFAPLFADHECWGNTGQSKSENLRAVIRRNGLRAPLFVGDTAGDEAAAKANDVPFAFAAYGFGACADPRFRVDSFPALRALVLA